MRAPNWKDFAEQGPADEVTIQEAAKPQTPSPKSNVIPAREVQEYARQKVQENVKGNNPADATTEECSHDRYSAPSRPTIRKQAPNKNTTPIQHIVEWVDGLLARNQTCLGGHWLHAPPWNYHFGAFTVGTSRQIASTIESKGYCVEPDARFGSGAGALALFKPLDGDQIQPSAAYLGAANLLRLCMLITIADGKIEPVELDVFRRAIENQPGLSLTDHKRLLILEQLLAQELCSASQTAAKIAMSIPADKRFVIGKLLVEVAAANAFITDGERSVLEKIFKSLEIPLATLESLIAQICPSQRPRPDLAASDVSKNHRWLWSHWRGGHPGVVIGDTTLAGKSWNFNDWKALNARWQNLHDRLVARQKNPARTVAANGELISKQIIAPKPKEFTLDPAKIFAIQSDTKEVVAILSVFMEDEPEKPIAPTTTITLPLPEIPKVSGDSNAAPQTRRFDGLDPAFRPILERLMARDSWPKNEFKSLADEFHFMPSKIQDTLNEWSDGALGDFILDGDDPVVIHRELLTKENVYG